MGAERVRGVVCGVFALALAACGGDDEGGNGTIQCAELPPTCSEAFQPTWDKVYEDVIQRRCGGSAGVACHGPNGKMGNLVLYEKESSYRALLGMDGTRARVEPMDPDCSMLMERLTTTDEARRMPLRANPLTASEICSVQKWIEQGANP